MYIMWSDVYFLPDLILPNGLNVVKFRWVMCTHCYSIQWDPHAFCWVLVKSRMEWNKLINSWQTTVCLHVHWNVHRYKLCDMKWSCFSNTILHYLPINWLTMFFIQALHAEIVSPAFCLQRTSADTSFPSSNGTFTLPLAQIPLKHILVCIPLDYMEWESTPHRHCFIGVLYSCQASNKDPLGTGRMSPDWRLW